MQDAAAAFCAKHGLPAEVVGPLAAHIADNLTRAMLSPGATPPASELGDGGADMGKAPDTGATDAQPPSRSNSLDFGSYDGDGAGASGFGGADAESGDSGEGSIHDGDGTGYVASMPLPEAAARLAEERTYTAPASPTKRGARGGGGGGGPAPFAEMDTAVDNAAEAAEAEEGVHRILLSEGRSR